MIRLIVPPTLNPVTLERLLCEWDEADDEVIVDFRRQRFVQPVGTVALACLIEHHRRRGQRVWLEAEGCENHSYWDRMGFFELVDTEPRRYPGNDAAGRFCELRQISGIDFVDEIASELGSTLAHSDAAQQIFSHVITEALNNVCQHSGSNGFCASQWYPNGGNFVRVAIGDAGVGLRNALARFELSSDAAAIKKALEVGVSGRSRAEQLAEPEHMRNRGVGLSTIRRLVTLNGGVLELRTGDTRYIETANHSRSQAGLAYWQGTLLSATLPREAVTAEFRDVMREMITELREVERERERRRRVGS